MVVTPNEHTWSSDSNGYALSSTYKLGKVRWIKLHRLILQAPAHLDTDHLNGDKLDNRVCNLRTATTSENGRAFSKRKSGRFRNVRQVGRKFYTRGWDGQREVYIGKFDTAKDAAKEWDKWAIENGYKREALNFPEEMEV
jgi:hypothetical protein